VIFMGAEKTHDFQSDLIREWTGAFITDQFGSSEGCGNASPCELKSYHEDFEFGHLEMRSPEPRSDGLMTGELLCTGFTNPVMPLIRYAVGDAVSWYAAPRPCECGRASKLIEDFDGRVEDYVVTPQGRRIMRFDYVFKKTHGIAEAQIIQDREGHIRVQVIPRETYGPEDESSLRAAIAEWISPRLEVDIEPVERIPREPNGKFRAVKSLLVR
jgi:phenylacetate-CoA ligase